MGRALFAQLVSAVPSSPNFEVAYLDFSKIKIATASFLREGIVAFRDYARTTLPSVYPVIGNAEPAVGEELEFFLRHRGDAMWSCQITANGSPENVRLLGQLDDVQLATLNRVLELGTASAPELADESKDASGVRPTAWNNRLTNLSLRGLLRELKSGKTKTYAPILEVGNGNRLYP